jgi:hypothetical protein
MQTTKHALIVFSCLILLDGCSREGSINLPQSVNTPGGTSPSASSNGPVKLGAGELDEVYSLKTKLPLGGHIDVGATNGKLTFKPDNSPAHSAVGSSVTIRSAAGTTESTPAFVSPEAHEILKRRLPAR